MRNLPRVESVHRALVLLKLITEEGSIGVSEAALALDVNASTAQRLLATLALDGFAEQDHSRRYRPGRALDHGRFVQTVPELRRQLRPHLEKLFERVGETVHIATLVGTRIQHLDGIEGTGHGLRFGLRTGVWLPAHSASAGKALLAGLSDEDVEARYRVAISGGHRPEHSVDMTRLREQLTEIRSTRVATNFEESEPGVAAFAIDNGEINGERAALSIAVPIARFHESHFEKYRAALCETADEVAATLRRESA